MTPKTSSRSSSRSTSRNGSEGAATPPGGALPPLPVSTRKEAAAHLRRPFPAEAIKFKVQTQSPKPKRGEKKWPVPTSANLVAYIDARLVSERLNLVCPDLWSHRFETVGNLDSHTVVCFLKLGECYHDDIGVGQGFDAGVKIKAARSDALKRTAVHVGVGVSVYAFPIQPCGVKKGGGKDNQGRPLLSYNSWDNKVQITAPVEQALRDEYKRWLKGPGAQFGDPLDHGWTADSAGDVDEMPPDDIEPRQDDLELAARREEIEKRYAAAIENGVPKSKLTKGKFDAQLRQADTSEKLDELEAKVKELADA